MKRKIIFFAILIVFFFIGCNNGKTKFVEFNNNKIQYMGRIEKTDSTANLYWSGSSIKIEFEGTSISAFLKDERGDNYLNVIIDDSISILHLERSKKIYELASNLPKGKHSVHLFKRTEWSAGKTSFYKFQFNSPTEVLTISPKKKTIEFYGNSITAGYAVEDYSGNDSYDSIFTNNYNSYAAFTARHFDANYTCIAKSGIGITVSWEPLIMQDIYDKLNPTDKTSIWDFSKSNPDIVVINLLQNDSWLVNMPKHEQFKKRFGEIAPTKDFIINAYKDFVEKIRDKYKSSSIICMLGNMDITRKGSLWPNYVKDAVKLLNDEKIYTFIAPYKNSSGHPRIEEQQIMADSLIKFIENNINW